LGDTDVDSALLSDEEIAAVLTLKGSEDAACLTLAKGLLARYGREPVKVTQDGQTLDFSARVEVWRELIADLERQSVGGLRVRRIARPQSMETPGEYTA
jgi:hypothetical protein